MESRLRQPGWGGKQIDHHGGRDLSLPPILDGRGGGGYSKSNDVRRGGRSSSVGAGRSNQSGSGRTGAGDVALRRPETESSAAQGRGPGTTDHSLPPLPRRSVGSAPEVRGASNGVADEGRYGAGGSRQSASRLARELDEPPQRYGSQTGRGCSGQPRCMERSQSRPRQLAPLQQEAAELVGTPPSRNQRPPAAPRTQPGGQGELPHSQQQETPQQGQLRLLQQRRQRSSSRKALPRDGGTPNSGTHSPNVLEPVLRQSSHTASPTAAPAPTNSTEQQIVAAAPSRARANAQQQRQRPARAEPAAQPEPAPITQAPAERPESPTIKSAAVVSPEHLAEMAEDQADAGIVDLVPCQHCGRKFKREAHERHVSICQKVFQQKRKVYNTTEHRLPDASEAPELAEVRRKAALMAKKGEVGIGEDKSAKPAKSAWRQKSEAFRAAMKDAQIVKKFQKEGRPLSELPPPAATAPELDDRVPCPHCGRRFGQQQAERHIPQCKNTKAKAKPPPVRGAAGSAAPKGAGRKGRNA